MGSESRVIDAIIGMSAHLCTSSSPQAMPITRATRKLPGVDVASPALVVVVNGAAVGAVGRVVGLAALATDPWRVSEAFGTKRVSLLLVVLKRERVRLP